MIITLTRSGGFTGIPQKKTIDTKTLDPEKARIVEDLVSKSNLFASERQTHRFAPTSPDRFIYTITIQNDTCNRNVPIHEESIDFDMQRLIECLQNV